MYKSNLFLSIFISQRIVNNLTFRTVGLVYQWLIMLTSSPCHGYRRSSLVLNGSGFDYGGISITLSFRLLGLKKLWLKRNKEFNLVHGFISFRDLKELGLIGVVVSCSDSTKEGVGLVNGGISIMQRNHIDYKI